jgi:hypothetical protein
MSIYVNGRELHHHGECLGDEVRTESFERAISEVVRPGDVVVDVGTGTGILAFFACRAGASRVYAVDPSPVIRYAEQIAGSNGFSSRITFIEEESSKAELPERADVFIAGHIHNFALEFSLLSSLLDARKRLLKEHPRFIPLDFELIVTAVESPNARREIEFWNGKRYGVDFSPVCALAANNCLLANFSPGEFLAEPQTLLKIDPATVESAVASGHVSCVASRAGIIHGIGGWFRARLSENVELTNDPRNKTASWAQIFFPLEMPVAISPRDQIEMTISTNDGRLWRWQTRVGAQQSDQCSAFGLPLPGKPSGRNFEASPSD